MLVKQLSIFVENKPGRLSDIIKLLGENGVNLSALSLADTTNFGVLRLIADKTDVAQAVLRDAGIVSKCSDVLAVAIDDTPGALTGILDLFTENGVSVEYMYAFSKQLEGKAQMVVKTDMPTFDMENLRWSKIIICTDADEDGFQIRTLLLTIFYRLLPSLLSAGKVFIAESPLFEITVKDDIYFAYNEFEKAEILKKLEGKKYTLQRSKGLGENEPDMMWKTTMNPETRRLIAVTTTDAQKTFEIFDTLLGDNLEARKRFITEHGSEYVKDADI